MDELMRHQPTLKTDAMTAIIKVFFVTNFSSFMRVVFQQQVPLLVRAANQHQRKECHYCVLAILGV